MKILLILIGGGLLAQTPPLIDLVANPAKPMKPRVFDGVVGGRPPEMPRTDPKLPLEIDLESVQRTPGSPQFSVVSMLLKNAGTEPYLLPVGRDGDAALAPDKHDRHEFWFNLQAEGVRASYLQGQDQVTYASTDLPETFLKIAPRGVVRVRFKVDLKDEVQVVWKGRLREGQKELSVRGVCVDVPYDDSLRRVRHLPFPYAASANELRIPITWDEEATQLPKR